MRKACVVPSDTVCMDRFASVWPVRRLLCSKARSGLPVRTPWQATPRSRARRIVFPATSVRTARDPVRALRLHARPQPGGREPWPPTDRHGRLERWDEPGRSGREGRERLARLVMVGNIPTV